MKNLLKFYQFLLSPTMQISVQQRAVLAVMLVYHFSAVTKLPAECMRADTTFKI